MHVRKEKKKMQYNDYPRTVKQSKTKLFSNVLNTKNMYRTQQNII